jgi:glutamate-5-semialdehyde dehydrogenase
MATITESQANAALAAIANALQANKDAIVKANTEDLKNGESMGLQAPVMKRLLFDEAKLAGVIDGIHDLISLDTPVGAVSLRRELDKDLLLEKVSCPIGVIGVIFESRPDALVQIATLCLKSGNCAILKGGSEAIHSNRVLFETIRDAGIQSGLPEGFITLLETRSEISEMLKCYESIDLIIPRGSNEFVRYIMDNSEIPVMGHSDGICHVYVDETADIAKAVPIIRDSKTQYVAACNAVETVLVHKDIAQRLVPSLMESLSAHQVEVRGDATIRSYAGDIPCACEDDYKTEYLDYIVSVKVVDNIGEAIDHINKYGSHHTDSIVTEDADKAADFMQQVDSSSVYHNCSTRFADGFRYGFGAEVGISTGKLHARGPVGLDGLVTYKYRLFGSGTAPHIVDDYATGKKQFNFRDLT